jgi:WD40 repeat protein
MRRLGISCLVVSLGASCHRAPSTEVHPSSVSSAAANDGASPHASPSATASSPGPGAAVVPDRAWVAQFKGAKVFAEKHPLGVLAVAFLPDGVHGMSSGVDEVARVWDLRTGEVSQRHSGPRFKFHQVVFTRDGKRALSASDSLAYWWVATGDVVRDLPDDESAMPSAVALSRDDRRAVVGSPGKVTIWDLESGTPSRQFALRGQLLSVRFTDDDRHVQMVTDLAACVADDKGDAPPTCDEFPLLEVGRIVSASTEERETLLGTREGLLFLWDHASRTAKRHWAAQRPTREVVSIDFRSDLHRALSAGDSTVKLWDVSRGTALAQLPAIPKWALAVALSSDGQLGLVGSEGGTVHLWKLPAAGGM